MKPRLLDAFSGAGGAGMGYHLAGFEVVGVDINPQPHYPFEFYRGDALEFVAAYGQMFDAIHASPPCQAYSNAQRIRKNTHPDLIIPTRKLLNQIGRPYIIENVPGAPLINPVTLIGTMFNLWTIRPRLFECSFNIPLVLAPIPGRKQIKMGRPPTQDGDYIQIVGNFSNVEYARQAMGIDWMTRDELSQAIPPAYTKWIGEWLIEMIGTRALPEAE